MNLLALGIEKEVQKTDFHLKMPVLYNLVMWGRSLGRSSSVHEEKGWNSRRKFPYIPVKEDFLHIFFLEIWSSTNNGQNMQTLILHKKRICCFCCIKLQCWTNSQRNFQLQASRHLQCWENFQYCTTKLSCDNRKQLKFHHLILYPEGQELWFQLWAVLEFTIKKNCAKHVE